MSSLKKRGERWYIKFSNMVDGKQDECTLSLDECD